MKLFLLILVILFAGLCPANFVFAANALDIVISEICWMGTEISSADEWIELYNNTNKDISLDGWGIYENNKQTLIEPLLNSIPKFSYYIIERTDDTTIPDILASQTPSGWSGYGLKNSGEHIQLIDNNSNIIDDIPCSDKWFAGEAKPDYKTMERKNLKTSGASADNWQTSAAARGTPMAENSKPSEPETSVESDNVDIGYLQPQPLIIEYPDGIIINEILPSPEGRDAENEWIEIFNQNNFPVDVSDWKITDTQGKIKSYTLPQNTIIHAKSFLLLQRPQTKITLNNSNDGLNLIQPNGTITDAVVYKKTKLNQSYNRIGDKWVWNSILTPGWENIISEDTNETKNTKNVKKTSAVNVDSVDNANDNIDSADRGLTPVLNSVKHGVPFADGIGRVAGNFKFAAIILALLSASAIVALKRSIK